MTSRWGLIAKCSYFSALLWPQTAPDVAGRHPAWQPPPSVYECMYELLLITHCRYFLSWAVMNHANLWCFQPGLLPLLLPLLIIESYVNQMFFVAWPLNSFWGILIDNSLRIFWAHFSRACLIHPLDSDTNATMEKVYGGQHWSERAHYWFEQVRKVTLRHFKAVTGPKINYTNNCM